MLRPELLAIADMVLPGARVLDVGCGDGALLKHLAETKGADARGIELSQAGVNACVAQGLSVIQGDADTDLVDYPSNSFDYAILSQTIQATRNPRIVLDHLLRIARETIVSFPNFGFWKVRLKLAVTGRMPRTAALPMSWYDTPNIHLCTLADFLDLSADLRATTIAAIALRADGRVRALSNPGYWDNLSAEAAIFRLSRKGRIEPGR